MTEQNWWLEYDLSDSLHWVVYKDNTMRAQFKAFKDAAAYMEVMTNDGLATLYVNAVEKPAQGGQDPRESVLSTPSGRAAVERGDSSP